MKNKILKALFLIIMVFSLSVCSDVRATENAGGSDTNVGDKVTDNKGSWAPRVYVGVRFTLVDSAGNRIPGTISVDYLSNTSTIPPDYIYYSYEKKTRKEVLNSGASWMSIREYKAKTGKTELFDTLNFKNFWIEGTQNYYFETYVRNMDSNQFMRILNTLAGGDYNSVTSINTLIQDGKVCKKVQQGYLFIEPLALISVGGSENRNYFGTSTELMQLINSRTSSGGAAANSVANLRYRVAEYNLPYIIHLSNSTENRSQLARQLGFIPVTTPEELIITDSYSNFDKVKFILGKSMYKSVESSGKPYGVGIGAFKIDDANANLDCATTCWKTNVTCEPLECKKTNENSVKTCVKKMESYECEYSEKDNAYNSVGEQTFSINPECSLYCTEEATVSYPGNIGQPFSIYEPFAWPTNGGTYPLTTKSTLICTPMMNDGSPANATCLNEMNSKSFEFVNGSNNAYVEYEHNQYGTQTAKLDRSCSQKFDKVSNTLYKISSECTYTLPIDKNIAIDKGTAEVIERVAADYASAVNNFILITKYNGVLPKSGFSWIDDAHTFESLYDKFNGDTFSKDYQLKIKSLSLGYAGKGVDGTFTNSLKADEDKYVCHYNITLAPSTECICPPGTVWAGTDINGKIKDTAQTCAEAKEIYCNQGTITPPKYNNPACPPDSKYPERNCTDYINNGGTEAECIANWCNDSCTTNCDYVCPKKSDYPDMDISACVSGQLGAGKKLAQALSYCIEKNCYRGANIIYRTISLENPFPSKDADLKVNQTGLTKGMFNTTIKGRYPGTNWNSITLVKNKILNNRGYNGSEIYEKAKPLYVIELDPTAIKKIREYNKKQEDNGGYSDFTLKCTDGAYCISSFIRSSEITTADGTNMLTGGTCASASNKKTFTNCYTYK